MESQGGDGVANAGLAGWVERFSAALQSREIARVTGLFGDECYWRDLLAFTWNIKTLEGRAEITDMLEATLGEAEPSNWQVVGQPMGPEGAQEGWIEFETRLGRGKGYVRLRDGRCWTLLTALRELKGHEEPRGKRRPNGAPNKVTRDQTTWSERRRTETETLGHSEQPYVLIIGGGQGGLGLGARLKMLGVPTLIIDRLPGIGDQWRSRYESLCLHDPVWYDHMPYLPFPSHWPVFTPKDKMAEWLEIYAKAMELNVWTSCECTGATYDEAAASWQVTVRYQGKELVLHPRELVLAMGGSGKPKLPSIPGMESFQGPSLHSSQYRGGDDFSGKTVAVIGSNNSAHDICADLWQHGAQPVMIQRSPTVVVRSEMVRHQLLGPIYSEEAVENGVTTETADMLLASIPYRLLPEMQQPLVRQVGKLDAEFYERLGKSGFMYSLGEDDTGIYGRYVRSASGYYIDVGASDLIASGEIGLRADVDIDRIEPDGLVLSDGSKLTADALVYATGFGSMDEWAHIILAPENAAKIGRCWGYGSDTPGDPGPWEGELRNMWKPTAQKGLWFHGGNLYSGRHYSLYLALQLKARMEALPIHVYAAP